MESGITHAQGRARALRRELGLHGQVDAEGVADRLGLEVWTWPFQVLEEMQVENAIAVAARLDGRWRRWVVAHAIAHSLLHPGNHLWLRDHTLLGHRVEREAEEFAGALLMDGRETLEQGLVHPWEVAEYFGVPEEMVRLQGPVDSPMRHQRGVPDGRPHRPPSRQATPAAGAPWTPRRPDAPTPPPGAASPRSVAVPGRQAVRPWPED